MRILIVDDGDEKVSCLLKLFEGAGISANNIIIANCVNDAKRLLREHQFAFAILDLSIANTAGGVKNHQNGFEFAQWIVSDRTQAKKPWSICVITGLEDAYDSHQNELRELEIPIFKWRPEAPHELDAILQHTSALIDLEKRGALEATSHRIDVCVVCALMNPEFKALCDAFGRMTQIYCNTLPPNSQQGKFETQSGSCIDVILTTVGEMGNVPMSFYVSSLIKRFAPRTLILCGICAGFEGKASLGDLICSTGALNFRSGKLLAGDFLPDALYEPTSAGTWPDLKDHLRMTKILNDVNGQWHGARPSLASGKVQYLYGSVGCSDLVVADKDFVQNLLRQYRQMLGLEMESFGAAYASNRSANGTKFLMFKSVCDLADPNKKDSFQDYSAYLSANFVMQLLYMEII